MPSVASVEGKCLLISVLFVNISQVLTRIRTIAKNVEYAGRLTQKIFFFMESVRVQYLRKELYEGVRN